MMMKKKMCNGALRMLVLAGYAISCYATSVVYKQERRSNEDDERFPMLKHAVWKAEPWNGVSPRFYELTIDPDFRQVHDEVLAGKRTDPGFVERYQNNKEVYDLPAVGSIGDSESYKLKNPPVQNFEQETKRYRTI